MEFTKEDLELETVSVEPSDICLSSSAQKCQVCKTGTVVKVGRKTDLIIYTRSGTLRGIHEERRCNNRTLPCRAGHFYGYVRSGQSKVLDDDILQNKYLITSNQTAFAIDYLWDITLQILFMRATFEGLGNVYKNLHYPEPLIPFWREKVWSGNELLRLSTCLLSLSWGKGMT